MSTRSELETRWDPRGAYETMKPYVDLETVVAEYQDLDWEALSQTFPDYGGVYTKPSFEEFLNANMGGAVALHADIYLAKRTQLISTIEGMSADQFAAYMGERLVSKDDLLRALHERQENEAGILSGMTVPVPIKDTPSMRKRGIPIGSVDLPATLFTSLNVAQTVFQASEFRLRGNYLLPRADRMSRRLHAPFSWLLAPKEPAVVLK